MKIIHVSDSHGGLIDLPEGGDVVISSGDFFPNITHGVPDFARYIEEDFQTKWLNNKIEEIKAWLKERPFLFCSGNHDFINPEKQLRAAGIKCWSLDDKLIEFEGFTFYGFPYVPPIAGGWMFESNKIEMQKHFEVMDKVVENSGKKLDILVAHCPPWGYLDDWGGHNIGNSVLTDRLSYEDNDFSYLLCGHNHDSNCRGKTILFGDVLISNAATTFNVIEIKEKKNGNQENS